MQNVKNREDGPVLENYLVWFDNLLEEYFWLEEGQMTDKLRQTLESEQVVLNKVAAPSPAEALEKIFPKRKDRTPSTRRFQ